MLPPAGPTDARKDLTTMTRIQLDAVTEDRLDEDTGLRPSERDRFAVRLSAYREALRERHANHMSTPREGDGTHADDLDGAAMSQDNSLSLSLAEKAEDLLQEIEAALRRIDDGSFGICEGTGEPIGFKRLDARPWSRHSVVHQEERERTSRTFYRYAP